jgi:hypothetical protein
VIVPGLKGYQREPLEVRFWPRIVVPGIGRLDGRLRLSVAVRQAKTVCWIWTGSKTGRGYGSISYQGKPHRTHRIAWSLFYGLPFPADKDGCHTCDNPPCVNPFHIWPGTMSENILDAVAKGHKRGPGRTGKNKILAEATHCQRGHPFTDRRDPRGKRVCEVCRKARDAKRDWGREKRERKAKRALLAAAAPQPGAMP